MQNKNQLIVLIYEDYVKAKIVPDNEIKVVEETLEWLNEPICYHPQDQQSIQYVLSYIEKRNCSQDTIDLLVAYGYKFIESNEKK